MPIPNRNILWSRVLVDELLKQSVDTACVAPGSRSTPLVTALSEQPEIELFSQLDERCAGFFALGHASVRDKPVPLVSTSGTAAVNFHPAVVEAFHAHVPMLLLTADRPPVLQDSGANQTIDQAELYGSSVRWFQQLPEPEPDERKCSALRRQVAQAVSKSTGPPAGPVHLNVPFRKPLAPEETEDAQLEAFRSSHGEELPGAQEEPIRISSSECTAKPGVVDDLATRMAQVDRCCIVAGPYTGDDGDRRAVRRFVARHDVPLLADPLSGFRFGTGEGASQVLGGYDGYAPVLAEETQGAPDLVVRVGANPTSKALTRALSATNADQVLVNPSGDWTDDTFTATDLVTCDPEHFFPALDRELDAFSVDRAWNERLFSAERACWREVEDHRTDRELEAAYVMQVLERIPDPADLFVSNSMPVRDLDRFGRPMEKDLRVFGNRGASGIDGIVSSALGVASGSERELVLITGDLALYHDMNGLVAISRFNLDATIVVLNNDGGGIFHMLPIEDHDPPFSDYMKTPHGLDFSHAADMYGLNYWQVEAGTAEFREVFDETLDTEGAHLINVMVDGEESHRRREEVTDRIQSSAREAMQGNG